MVVIVSTHAPARGATEEDDEGVRVFRVSTHAPARGATLTCSPCLPILLSFNPRTRTGCDAARGGSQEAGRSFNPRTRTGCDQCLAGSLVYVPVSTHAPARGATSRKPGYTRTVRFQPTHPHGVRPILASSSSSFSSFNPRTRTGCDNLYKLFQPCNSSFNPRTRTGCDRIVQLHLAGIPFAFQPTHPHGVRRQGLG